MKNLSCDWLLTNPLDAEYKRYILLDYLQKIERKLNKSEIYPIFTDLYNHYIDLIKINNSLKEYDDFISGYLKEICEFSIPKIENYLRLLQEKIDEIESKLFFINIGIEPLNKDFGFIFISSKSIMVYEYDIKLYEISDSKYRGIHMEYLKSYKKSISNTYENIKADMAQKHYNLKNPSTLAIVNKNKNIPYNEAILPIAKLAVLRYFSKK